MSHEPFPNLPRVSLRDLLISVAVAVGYWLSAKLGLYFATLTSTASPVWPGAGIYVGAIILFGPRILPAIFLGSFVVNIELQSPLAATLITASNLLEVVTAWMLYDTAKRLTATFPHFKDALAFSLIAVISAAIGAVGGTLALNLDNPFNFANIGNVWLTWWVGDSLGILVVAPLLIALPDFRRHDYLQPSKLLHVAALIALTVATAALIFLTPYGPRFLFVLFLLLLYPALTRDSFLSRVETFFICALAIAATLFGHGPFMQGTVNSNLVNLELFLSGIAVTALMLEALRRMEFARMATVILVVGWSLSNLLYNTILEYRLDREKNAFESQVRQADRLIQNDLEDYGEVLISLAGMHEALSSLSNEDLKGYFSRMDTRTSLPGLYRVGFVRARDEKETAFFEDPTHPEPAVAREFRLHASPLRDAAITVAREGGRLALVANESGLLALQPVYHGTYVPQSEARRDQEFDGWLYATFTPTESFEHALDLNEGRLSLKVFDGPDAGVGSPLFDSSHSHKESSTTSPGQVSTLKIGNHTLALAWAHAHSRAIEESEPAWAAFTASLITLLITTCVAILQTLNVRARILASHQTQLLRKQKQAIQALQERYELIVNGATDGIWDWDIASNEMYLSTRWKAILGYQEEELASSYATWVSIVHPEDDHRNQLSIFDHLTGKAPIYRFEGRLRHKNGSYLWVIARGNVIRDPLGQPVRMVGCLFDTTERKKAELEIVAAREAALQATRAKSHFLANISHELRTPLSCILGTVALLRGSRMNADQYDYVEVIGESANILLDTINDVLDFSKIEAGKLTLESIDFNLAELIEDVCRVMRFAAAQKDLELNVDHIGIDDIGFRGDPTRIRQVLINLLSNAVKFTKVGHVHLSVHVRLAGKADYLARFTVKDTGIGISKKAREHLFEAFAQGDDSTSRKFGGTGLGLSICKRLVHLMRGHIGMESIEGEGSTFTFEIPLSQGQLAPGAGSPFPEDLHVTRGARILVVEDNMINQRVSIATLKQSGYAPSGANNGRQALEILAREHFDLILMDCQMPEMDGYEAAKILREDPQYGAQTTPIVAVTANAQRSERERGLANGMTDYLTKPIKLSTMVHTIERLLPKTQTSAPPEKVRTNALSAEVMNKIIDLFLQTAPEHMSRMHDALVRADWKSLSREAHQFYSSCADLGLKRAAELCRAIEDLAQDHATQAPLLLQDLQNEIARGSSELEARRAA